MEGLPQAKVCHAVSYRTRIRIPEKKGDEDYLVRIGQQLAEYPTILSVKVNATTASILLIHQGELVLPEIQEFAAEHGLFRLEPEPELTAVRTSLDEGVASLNRWLKSYSDGQVDYRGLLVLVFLGMAIVQITRGKLMAPAASLLWYVVTLLNERHNDDGQ